jgi:hypothetical protein
MLWEKVSKSQRQGGAGNAPKISTGSEESLQAAPLPHHLTQTRQAMAISLNPTVPISLSMKTQTLF